MKHFLGRIIWKDRETDKRTYFLRGRNWKVFSGAMERELYKLFAVPKPWVYLLRLKFGRRVEEMITIPWFRDRSGFRCEEIPVGCRRQPTHGIIFPLLLLIIKLRILPLIQQPVL